MRFRPRTVRRLLILLAAVLVLVGTGAALYYRNEHRKTARLQQALDAGMKAYAAGDYKTALNSLKSYVSRVKSNPEALFAYGVSRSRIEETNGKHITEGITVFTTLIALDPANSEAKHRLLDLYTQAGYSNEAIDLSDRVLAEKPDDLEALRAKCTSLERLRKYDEALATSEKICQLQPTDLEQQLTTYRLMAALKRPSDQLIARAVKQKADHPGDPRFDLLLAWVYGSTGDTAKGSALIKSATTRPAPDATYVRYMVRVLDSLKQYKDAQDLLDRAVKQNADPAVMRVLVQRLWQNGRINQVIERTKDLNANTADAGLIAFRALAQFETGKPQLAKADVDALASRAADGDAIAWSMALGARFAGLEPKAALEQYQAAVTRSPDNAVIRYLIGEAYARLGETELAIAAWRRSAEMSPSWAGPRVQIARTLATAGRLKEAVQEAQLAFAAGSDQLVPAVTLANVQYRALEQGEMNPSLEPTLLAFVTRIQQVEPGEPETLPTYVSLLARAGKRDEALTAAGLVARDPKRYDQGTRLRLSAVSRAQKLGLENELGDVASVDGATDPRIALAGAMELATAGKADEGLALLESRAKSATTRPAQWTLVVLQFKELTKQPAAKEWIALGDSNPDDLAIQTGILKSAISMRSDREFIARTIDRVKNLTGPEGQTWKLERARWLIGSETAKDAAEAVNTLTDIVRISPTLTEARVLLASAYESVGNAAAAIKELEAATRLEPSNIGITLELSRMLQSENRFADARTYLERAANSPDVTSEIRRRIAAALAGQGDYSRAASVLESARKEADPSSELLLAEIYRRQNRSNDAQAIYLRQLDAKPPTVDAVRAAAEFYAEQRKFDLAKKTLDRIRETGARPGVAELIIASYDERFGDPEDARKNYLAATVVAPTDATAWRNLVAFYLRRGEYANARQSAIDALRNLPDDQTLKRLSESAGSLERMLAENASWRPVLAILASATPDDRGASEFLTASRDPASQPTAGTMLGLLRSAASRHPRSLALRSALVQWHVARKEYEEAAKVARENMEAFPNDASSARVAATVFRSAKRYDLAAAAAQKWRERSALDPKDADWMLADIRLAQNDPASALRTLAPYAASLTADPRSNPAMLTTLLRAQSMGGKEADARALLRPMLAEERRWRSLWMQLASASVLDPLAAESWLKEITPIVLIQDASEQVELADAWYILATRAPVVGALEQSARLLDSIAARSDAPASAILLRGAVADRMNDPQTAEASYRRGLELANDQPGPMNNLAYLILLRGGDLAEARKLIDRAITLAPDNAGFYDTLARIQLQQNQRDAAIASFEKALKLDPQHLEAMVGLATTYCDAGRREPAAGLLVQIDSIVRNKPPMSPQLRKELESLRATMKASL